MTNTIFIILIAILFVGAGALAIRRWRAAKKTLELQAKHEAEVLSAAGQESAETS